ncbi:MAG TPA: CBS domain-containing protein [Stellaceae bacterium]|nr:CBS domain-containing protein [Stellaceae bacterium]
MNVEAILKSKGSEIVTIAPTAPIVDAVRLLSEKRIGALVVITKGDAPQGILSERDIVHALAERGAKLFDLTVGDLMTRRVVTCAPGDSIAELMAQMTAHRIRHLPVLANGRLVGIVSIGDVVKNRLEEIEGESASLRDYIAGAA